MTLGLLQDGLWVDQWYDTSKTGGHFVRRAPQFRNWITADGSAGPSGDAGFKAEAGRYHLFVSLACPWAHRTLIFRKLKKLEHVISVSIVKPEMLDNGWELEGESPITGIRYLYEVYIMAQPNYSGRVTVPVLWDKQTNTIVNNESAEIIRMLNSAFNDVTDVTGLPAEIDGDAVGISGAGFAQDTHQR